MGAMVKKALCGVLIQGLLHFIQGVFTKARSVMAAAQTEGEHDHQGICMTILE